MSGSRGHPSLTAVQQRLINKVIINVSKRIFSADYVNKSDDIWKLIIQEFI